MGREQSVPLSWNLHSYPIQRWKHSIWPQSPLYSEWTRAVGPRPWIPLDLCHVVLSRSNWPEKALEWLLEMQLQCLLGGNILQHEVYALNQRTRYGSVFPVGRIHGSEMLKWRNDCLTYRLFSMIHWGTYISHPYTSGVCRVRGHSLTKQHAKPPLSYKPWLSPGYLLLTSFSFLGT